jgi:hypothetical protein
MNKGKEELRFFAESSKKEGLGVVAESSKKKKKNKKNNNKKKKPCCCPHSSCSF